MSTTCEHTTTADPYDTAAAAGQAMTGIVVAAAAQAAVKLGVFDALADEPTEVVTLARRLDVDADALARLLRPLTATGFVAAADDRVTATDVSRVMRTNTAGGMGRVALMAGDDWYWQGLRRLDEAVRTGGSVMPTLYGKGFFAHLAQDDPAAGTHFDAAMTDISEGTNEPVVAALDLTGDRTVADVGGGHGSMLRAVLERQPDVEGVLFDLEQVVAGAHPALRDGPLSERCRIVPGDGQREVPVIAEVYLLKHILHMWDDDICVGLLRNIAASAPAGARVIAIEQLLTDGPEAMMTALMDLMMLVCHGGRERTEADFADLYEQAGLDFVGVTPTKAAVNLVEGRVRG